MSKNDLLEYAWGVIANANGGNWDLASVEWKQAAERWRDDYFAMLNAERLRGQACALLPEEQSQTSNDSNDSYGINPKYRDDPAPLMRLFVAYFDLKCEGWREIMYAPKDGREIEVIECGSTGIHRARWHSFNKKEGQPDWVSDGCFFIDGDWPSHPILFRKIKADAK